MNHTIKRYDAKLQLFDSMITKGPVVDIEINKSNWLICDIGILNPNNGKNGSINKLMKNASNKLMKEKQKPEIDLLQRPVQLISGFYLHKVRKVFFYIPIRVMANLPKRKYYVSHLLMDLRTLN
jgi:hypothetical protein